MDRDARKQVRSLKRELQRKEKALAETAALLTLSNLPAASKKSPDALGGGRGRMISTPDRQLAVSLIDEARLAAVRPVPSHALTEDERQAVLETTPWQARGPLRSPITLLCLRQAGAGSDRPATGRSGSLLGCLPQAGHLNRHSIACRGPMTSSILR